ncbi:4691_t:CDS:2 [Ambispora gerdemannii]|uniref:4691_t:CDS:1 n=1 Tax=Ambispora gerdemannii TaxID=144530 RepID=A0A9N8VA64_9GLOM|nr:4691_t:CDS:2 [Ambispora gerdemannii]
MDVVMRDTDTRRNAGPNFGMNPVVPVNECTYETTFWPQISGFVKLALRSELQIERPLHTYSHEELYRCIYWMCWQGFQKKLHKDLLTVIDESLAELNVQLDIIDQPDKWILKFAEISRNHARAADILSSIFAYLDKTYIQYFLHDNLKKILFDQYKLLIIDKSERRIMYIFGLVLDIPEKFDTNVVFEAVSSLFKINSDLIYLNPTLFKNHIPENQMPCNLEGARIKHQQLETKYQIEDLKKKGWEAGISQLKRSASQVVDENEKIGEISAKRIR